MDKSLTQRLNDLETAYGLLQHDFEAQHQVILDNSKLIQQLATAVRRLTDQIEQLKAAADEEPRSLEDERPPHY